jgi:hypothetical protein
MSTPALDMVAAHYDSTGDMDEATADRMVGMHFFEEGAYHEAGHAIMYALFGLPFHSVTIEPDEAVGNAGQVRSVPKGKPGRRLNLDYLMAWKYATITAAGRAATDVRNEKHPEDKLMHFPESDIHDLAEIRGYAIFVVNQDGWIAGVADQARKMIRDVWPAVETLAQELMMSDGEDIPAKRVRKILRESRAKEVTA